MTQPNKLAGLLDQIEAELTKQQATRDEHRASRITKDTPNHTLEHSVRMQSEETLHLSLALAGIEGLRTIARIADALEKLASK